MLCRWGRGCDGVGAVAHGVCVFSFACGEMGGHTDFTDHTDFFRLRRNEECHTENTEITESFACGKKVLNQLCEVKVHG